MAASKARQAGRYAAKAWKTTRQTASRAGGWLHENLCASCMRQCEDEIRKIGPLLRQGKAEARGKAIGAQEFSKSTAEAYNAQKGTSVWLQFIADPAKVERAFGKSGKNGARDWFFKSRDGVFAILDLAKRDRSGAAQIKPAPRLASWVIAGPNKYGARNLRDYLMDSVAGSNYATIYRAIGEAKR